MRDEPGIKQPAHSGFEFSRALDFCAIFIANLDRLLQISSYSPKDMPRHNGCFSGKFSLSGKTPPFFCLFFGILSSNQDPDFFLPILPDSFRFSLFIQEMPHFCHIFATQFSRWQKSRKNLIFFYLDDSDSFHQKESEEPEISVSSQFFPASIYGNALVGGVVPVVLSFPY